MPDKGLQIKKQRLSAQLKTVKLLSFLISFTVIFFCFLGLGVQNKAHAATYYVDSSITDTFPANATPDCTNYNTGTFTCSGGAESAYATIADVNVKSFSSDDQILFRKGRTWREQLTVPSSGTSGHPITFGAFGSGNSPIISGAELLSSGWSLTGGGTPPTGSDGFEVGDSDLTNGDGAYWTNGYSPTNATLAGNETTTKRSGSYSAKVHWTAVFATAQGYHSIGASNTNYVNFDILVDTLTGSSTSTGVPILNYNGSSRAWLRIINDSSAGGTYTINLNLSNTGADVELTGTTTLNKGVWYNIEVYYKSNDASTGGGTLWINGTQEGSNLTLNTTQSNAQPNRVFVGLLSSGTNNTSGTIYFDNYKNHTAYMGMSYPDVWQKSVTTQPNQIFFDGTRGTNVSSLAGVTTANQWFWASNLLYVYSSSDPATAFTNPGIENSVRINTIHVNSKSYITIQGLNLQKANGDGLFLGTAPTNIIIDGCTVGNSYWQGITPAGESQYITVQNSTVNWNGASGINVDTPSHDWTIQDNIAHNNCQLSQDDHGVFAYSSGIKGWSGDDSVTHILIQRNKVYSQGKLPDNSRVFTWGGVGGIWIDSFAHTSYANGAVITKNEVYDNEYFGIFLENSSYNTVTYNLVYNNLVGAGSGASDNWGIRASDWANQSPASYNQIYNNVVYGNPNGIQISGSRGSQANRAVGNLVKNNIVMANTGYQLQAEYGGENDGTMGSGNVYTYNDFGPESSNFIGWGNGVYKSTYDSWETATGNCGSDGCSHSVESDPLFVGGSDAKPYPYFYPRSYSPVINAGVDVGLTKDYLNVNVPQGAAPDIGAFEYTVSIPENIWFFFPLFLALPRLIFILQNKKDRKYFLNLLKTHRYKAILLELYFPYLNLFSQLTKRADK